MLKGFRSKTKNAALSREKENPVSPGPLQDKAEKFRRLQDRVDPNESVISAQSSFKGEISGQAGVHILGNLEGDLRSEGLVHTGRMAKIKGNIHSPYVIH